MTCWIVGHLPEIDYVAIFSKYSAVSMTLIGLPVLSVLVVLCMYLREMKKQRKHIIFIQNFLSLFTNPEMQEGEMKEYEQNC